MTAFDLRKEEIKTEGRKLLLNALQLVCIRKCKRIANCRSYSTLDLTNVKYNMKIHSRDEKLEVTLRTRPSNLIQ
jgi:hypothetical protein